ncbi:MAG: S-methyl-5-thioribose-1-phosphate isomerase [Planctomycetia bacterium]|nr:S-methyl-5-thioribose-1-phosphate isomerase [Planctomycetia bacterium]
MDRSKKEHEKLETLHWQTPVRRTVQESYTLEDLVKGSLWMIDQTLLPVELKEIECRDTEAVWDAIKMLKVRGAPAIGIAAAYGICVGIRSFFSEGDSEDKGQFFDLLNRTADYLAASRPTAVNLFWALDRMKRIARELKDQKTAAEIAVALLEEARKIHEEDRAMCRKMGEYGASLVHDGDGLLTHCNAGGLATAEYGTALSVFFISAEQGKKIKVYADETRPLLQGARLTAWELHQAGIDTTLICDSMAAQVMKEGKIQAVFVGADRIAANGDTANKIGTYSAAVCAKAHGIPFYVVAPYSTFDLKLENGSGIPIEQRDPEEVRRGFGRQTAPDGVKIYNPAFDITPAELIRGIITERGIISPVNRENIEKFLG